MACSSTVSVAMPLTYTKASNMEGFKPLPMRSNKALSGKFQVRASLKEKAITGLTAAALTASLVIPEVAEAAGPGVSPSLKNFLLSIVAGGVVVTAIIGAVIGVANFDPVKRS